MSSEIVGAGDELQSFIKLAREIFQTNRGTKFKDT